MAESKKQFVALRLDEVIHEWEADAPAGGSNPGDRRVRWSQRSATEPR